MYHCNWCLSEFHSLEASEARTCVSKECRISAGRPPKSKTRVKTQDEQSKETKAKGMKA